MEQGSTRAAELDCGESFPVELSLPLPPPPPSVPSAQKEGVREDGRDVRSDREAARRRPPRTGEQQPAGRILRGGGGGGVSPERASRRASLRRGIGAGEHERGGGRRRRDAPAFNFRLSAGVGGVRAAWWVAETGNTPTEARRARREMIHDVGGGVR